MLVAELSDRRCFSNNCRTARVEQFGFQHYLQPVKNYLVFLIEHVINFENHLYPTWIKNVFSVVIYWLERFFKSSSFEKF